MEQCGIKTTLANTDSLDHRQSTIIEVKKVVYPLILMGFTKNKSRFKGCLLAEFKGVTSRFKKCH